MSNIKEVKKYALERLQVTRDIIETEIQDAEKLGEELNNTLEYFENKEDITKEDLENWKIAEFRKQGQEIHYEGLLQEREECFQKIQASRWFLGHLYNN